MVTVRRWYMFLICMISLQSVTWALIALLQDTVLGEHAPLAIAFQSAVIIVGLPVFLGHWLWAQRLAVRDPDERGSVLRCLYLYATLAMFLAPFADTLYDLVASLLALAIGEPREVALFFGRPATDAVRQPSGACIFLVSAPPA